MVHHLKGLDTLRAIAALVVVWGHIEFLKYSSGLPNLIEDSNFNVPSSYFAVLLFFVISGFLITYLLTKEREKFGKISLKKFYFRRILRIWPLYYTILLVSYLLLDGTTDFNTFTLCISGFPNVAHALGIGWSTSPQIWSIGVEEQFYLFWPILLMVLPEKRIPIFILLFFVGYTILPHLIDFINVRTIDNSRLAVFFTKLFNGTKFNSMSIGGLLGFLYAKKSSSLNVIKNPFIGYAAIVLTAILWGLGETFKYFTEEIFSILVAISIYHIVINPKIKIDTRVTSFVGRISFGIYMYHWIIISLSIEYLPQISNSIIYNGMLYISVISSTLFISWLSHISLERYFIQIKKKYEIK